MKDNKELLVSFYGGRGDTIATGTKLEIVPLCKVLWYQQNIDKAKAKGTSGCIFPYVQDSLGLNPERTNYSDGIIFIDIDKLPKSDIKCIYDGFETICDKLPNVLSCWYSNSYYNESKDYGGLHFVLRASNDTIDCDDYKYFVTFYGAILSRIIFNECGVDVRPTNDGKGLDRATKSIAQRFFLNYSQVKWNQTAYAVNLELDKKQLKEWVNEHNDWYKDSNPYKITKCEITKSDIVFNGNRVNLGYRGRITVLNTLATLGMSHSDRVELLMSICGEDDYRNGEEPLRQNVTQCSKTAENQKVSDDIIVNGIEILNGLGYDIQAEIERIYQPIDFDNDDLFMEVWESLKDQPYNNIYYSPKNYLRLNLKSSEYINDYKHQMNEMIYNYQMTYLIADCMVGKTTFGLNMQSDYGLFDVEDFIIHVNNDSIDLCVPYNSVADNKAKGDRYDIKRVMTKELADFKEDKRNVFIWNTVMPLYEKYFNLGLVKRLVLFFDESQKIVTDDYRWETVFEMFKVLPIMYKHFVFMTGTPAGELEYLKQYFPNYCVIKVDKEIEYKRHCKIYKYDKFGLGDRIDLIERTIESGKLPMIYSNTKNQEWLNACRIINKQRLEQGLRVYKILDYSRPNAGRLVDVNESNSISDYDIVIATKYCSVGIDFKKDDKRMRTAIVDYASEIDCTFHDIWQFTLRNRNQDTETIIVAYNNETYDSKLYSYWYYKSLFEDMAKIHTYKMVLPLFEDEQEQDAFSFAQEVFQLRKFGKLVNGKNNWFGDDRNVKLLGLYYLYVKIFSNMRLIKHMLLKRGVEIKEVDKGHVIMDNSNSIRKEMFNWFVGNYKDITKIYMGKTKYESVSYQININDDATEYIEDSKIWSRNVHYMDWLIRRFAGKEDWYEILLDCVVQGKYLTKESFGVLNKMKMMSRRMTTKDINKIKRFKKVMIQEDIDELVVDLISKHYKDLDLTKDEIRKGILMKDVIEDYRKIITFAIDNIEFIERIKNAESEGEELKACLAMQIAMEQQEEEKRKKKISNKMNKKYTVKFIKTGKIETFNGQDEFMKKFGCSRSTISKFINGETNKLSRMIQLIGIQ